jgi:transporter family-2 protein
MQFLLAVLAFAAGVVLVVQVGVNATLRNGLGSAATAAFMSFLVGSVALAALVSLQRAWPARAQFAVVPHQPAGFSARSTCCAHRRRATAGGGRALALVILAQLTTSLLVDHFGWLGFPQHPLTLTRLFGVALLFAGAMLIVHRA